MTDGYRDDATLSCPVEDSGRNDWGLFGVGGNVWECTLKNDSLTAHDAGRGASWYYGREDPLRCEYRGNRVASGSGPTLGLRLVLSRPGPE